MKNLDKIFMTLFIIGTVFLVVSVCFFRLAPFGFNVAMSVLEGLTAVIMLVLTGISAIKNRKSSGSWYSNPFQVIFSVGVLPFSFNEEEIKAKFSSKEFSPNTVTKNFFR